MGLTSLLINIMRDMRSAACLIRLFESKEAPLSLLISILRPRGFTDGPPVGVEDTETGRIMIC